MPYYGMGDYYQGDYYQGDPGIFGSILKLGAGALKSFTPAGRIASLAGRAFGALRRPSTALARTVVGGTALAGTAALVSRRPPMNGGPGGFPIFPGTRMIPSQMFPGGKPGLVASQRPAGYHWSESAGAWVRNRRMNVTNSRALRRAIRRASGFAKLAKRVLTFVQARAPKGRAKFKTRRR